MLSILIPVYNFDVTRLVIVLNSQANSANIDYEIIIIDDASEEEYKTRNRTLKELQNVKYLEEPKNLGRSRIRNKLADLSSYNYMLFVDCDSEISNDDYIQNYIDICTGDNVICGGRIYEPVKPDNNKYYLRWLHGIKREQFSARSRNSEPNKSFMTNNFVISKPIFKKVRFDETITNYGHEDTLFGYELKKNNIVIKHIDNPLIHIGLETNNEFLEKTKEGIKNLKKIMKNNGNEKVLIRDITLLHYFNFLRKLGITRLLRYLFKKSEKKLYNYLVNNKPILIFFDLYKLGYLCSIN
jgi:cellulose synthase/poly-beta-1,6-N-acetylglucosamine synthase-like glycosyltransferase